MRIILSILLILIAVPAWSQNVRRVKSVVKSGAVVVIPGQSIPAAITAAGEGGTILLKAGRHYITGELTPLNNQTFIGEKQGGTTRLTRLVGGRILTGWIPDSGRWYVTGQTQAGTVDSFPQNCDASHPRCVNPEDLFFNDAMKTHEDALADCGSGEWFFDYTADRIYVCDDPTNAFVETSVVPSLAGGSATGVTFRSLVVEKFASVLGTGSANTGTNWMYDDVEARWNHAGGFGVYNGGRVRNSYAHHNCQFGIVSGGTTNGVVENNEIAYNNILPQSSTTTCGFDPFWAAGGSKFATSTNMVVRRNYSHHNDGPGLWTDIDNTNTLYEYNVLESNRRSGIFDEISCSATIRYNWAIDNGTGDDFPGWVAGAGIEVTTSRDVEVHDNILIDNYQGITGLDDARNGGSNGVCTWALVNLDVHDNRVTSSFNVSGAGRTGVIDDGPGSPFGGPANNHFEDNTYVFGEATNYFFWNGGDVSDSTWQTTYGNDDTGSITRP